MVEVVALAHDVLLASGNILIAPLSKATCTIPSRAMSRAWLQEKREAYSRREQGGFARHRSEVDPPQAY